MPGDGVPLLVDQGWRPALGILCPDVQVTRLRGSKRGAGDAARRRGDRDLTVRGLNGAFCGLFIPAVGMGVSSSEVSSRSRSAAPS